MNKIYAALITAQSQMSAPVKNAVNPYFGKSYVDINSLLQAVLPPLNQNGIGVIQPTFTQEGKNYVKTVLIHESGETIESLTEIIYSKQNDAQAQGSGISYARRYGLQSLVCVGTEDDDANRANKPPKEPKQPEVKQPVDYSEKIKRMADVKSLQTFWNNLSQIDKDFNAETIGKMKTYLIEKQNKNKNAGTEQTTK